MFPNQDFNSRISGEAFNVKQATLNTGENDLNGYSNKIFVPPLSRESLSGRQIVPKSALKQTTVNEKDDPELVAIEMGLEVVKVDPLREKRATFCISEELKILESLEKKTLKGLEEAMEQLIDFSKAEKNISPDVFQKMEELFIPHVGKFDCIFLASFAEALALQKEAGFVLSKAIGKYFLSQIKGYSLGDLTVIAQSFDLQNPENKLLFSSIAFEAFSRSKFLRPADLAYMSTIFCVQCVENRELFHVFAKEVIRLINPLNPQMSPKILKQIILNFTKFDLGEFELLLEVTRESEDKRFAPKDLLGWNSMLECKKREMLYSSLLEAALFQINDLSLQDLLELRSALKKSNIYHEDFFYAVRIQEKRAGRLSLKRSDSR